MEGLTNKQGKNVPAQTTRRERVRVDGRGKRTDALGKHGGQVLADFLDQMEEHNAGVVLPRSPSRKGNVSDRGRQPATDH